MATTQEILNHARESLATYASLLRPDFELAPHIELLTREFEAVENGATSRLVVNLPPRHAKTSTAELLTAHYLGRFPKRHALYTTYGAELSERSGRNIRALVSDPRHRAIFPTSVISEDSSAVHRFDLTTGGGFFAVGSGGVLTGRGATLLVIDDLVKDISEARSPAVRRSNWDWYQFVLRTRCEPNACIVVLATRWALNDFVGTLLKESGERWRHVSLPALAEPTSVIGKLVGRGDLLGRREGEALWPSRFNADALAQIREEIGAAAFAALYQQRPFVEEGAVFDKSWWRSYNDPPKCSTITFSLDTAFKESQSADFSVLQVWGTFENGYALLHSHRARVGFPELKNRVVMFAEQWSPNAILVEDAASGQSLLQALKADTRLPVLGIKPLGDKVARASAVAPLVEAGKVFLPSAAGWLSDFMDEVSAFPTGGNDDQIDAMTQALAYLRQSWTPAMSREFHEAEAQWFQQREQMRRIREAPPGHMFNHVNDMLLAEDGFTSKESGPSTIKASTYSRRRWKGF